MRERTQSQISAMLKPWLDLAGLLGVEKEPPAPDAAPRELMELVLERGAAPRAVDDLFCTDRLPAKWFFPFGVIFDKQEAARSFYDFFYTVRKALTWATDSEQVKPAKRAGSFSEPRLGLGARTESSLYVTREGRLRFSEYSPWTAFGLALTDLPADRLRRCPVCRTIYYATRNNKGACDEHLTLARVRRKRARISVYEKARRFRRQKKLRGVRGNNYCQKQLLDLNRALTKHGGD